MVSFVAIQQLQQDQSAFKTNDKRSLLEIQEEEQARQTEEDFLKWWAEEEERVMLESQRPSQAPRRGSERSTRKHRKPKGTAHDSQVASLDTSTMVSEQVFRNETRSRRE
jgi:inhibitor of Bruton tyrosine kinase